MGWGALRAGHAPWGAFSGHPLEDIRSGRGVVHNAFLFDHSERTVLRAPFRIRPTSAWFPDHATSHELGPASPLAPAPPGRARRRDARLERRSVEESRTATVLTVARELQVTGGATAAR